MAVLCGRGSRGPRCQDAFARVRAAESGVHIKVACDNAGMAALAPTTEARGAAGAVLRPPLTVVQLNQTYTVTSAGYAHLAGVVELEAFGIDTWSDGDVAAFAGGGRLRVLSLHACDGDGLTDGAFAHLVGAELVALYEVTGSAITRGGMARYVASVPALNAPSRPDPRLVAAPHEATWPHPAGVWPHLQRDAGEPGVLPRHALAWHRHDFLRHAEHVVLTPWTVAAWAAREAPDAMPDVCAGLLRAAAVAAWWRRRPAVAACRGCGGG